MAFSLQQLFISPLWKRWAPLALCGLLAAYGVFIGANFAPVASGADSGGYFNSARLLTQGTFTTPMRTVAEYQPANPAPYIPLGYDAAFDPAVLRPTYPIGLPLHYAAASLVAGWYWGPLVIGVLGAVAAVFFCYGLLRELEVSAPLAVTGAAALAVSPMFLFSSFVAMSDTIATAWCTISVYTALRARRAVKWSLVCGAVFSMAVLVRPTNAILVPTLVLILGNWRNLLGAFLAGLPGAMWQGYYNHIMYGSSFRSGYGSVFDEFSWKEVGPSLTNYLATFPHVLPLTIPALLLLPFLPWKRHWRGIAACLLWFLSFAAFYAAYKMTPLTWWYLRFVLPTFPALIALGLMGLDHASRRWPRLPLEIRHYGLSLLVTVVSLLVSVSWCKKRHVMLMKPYQQPYVAATSWANQNMSQNALVACMQASSTFYFYTPFPILRWDQVPEADRVRLEAVFREARRPVYAVLFAFEEDRALKEGMPWNWEKVATLKDVGIWKLAGTP